VLSHGPTQNHYRGRLAPSPTGFLHLGHARTFWIAQQRASAARGTLVLRNEDLDRDRAKPEYAASMLEDLRWFGFRWQEGPDIGGPVGPYSQSERLEKYANAFEKLRAGGFVYPCQCSRQDVLRALQAPHAGDDEPVYPGTCRPQQPTASQRENLEISHHPPDSGDTRHIPVNANWRFRVPDGETISFVDGYYGRLSFIAGKDFGDFVIWRQDGVPAYQLAVVVDDALMEITEVVRGEDLLRSTARQLLLYRALGWTPPRFYHCPLVTDQAGERLAKYNDALSLRTLQAQGHQPEELRQGWDSLVSPSKTQQRVVS